MKISICFNCDSRNQNNTFGGSNLMGVAHSDMIVDSLINKIKFFDGFDIEVIVHLDRHNDILKDDLGKLYCLTDTLLVRKHTAEINFNCYNYLRALQLATGDIVCHIDQDTNCFARSSESVQNLIDLTEKHAFVSYPSYWSPKPVHDESFGRRTWASTRFFLCKKEYLKFDELYNCVREPEWGYAKYGDSPRRTNWLEHYLTLVNNDDCFYPPLDTENLIIFSWDKYKTGTMQKLNNMSFDEVGEFVNMCGGIHYPVDVTCI